MNKVQSFLFMLFLAGLIALVSCMVYFLDYASCVSRLDKMKMNGEHSFFAGCLVHVENGELIPLENYRFHD